MCVRRLRRHNNLKQQLAGFCRARALLKTRLARISVTTRLISKSSLLSLEDYATSLKFNFAACKVDARGKHATSRVTVQMTSECVIFMLYSDVGR